MFVKRDDSGAICAVSHQAIAGVSEPIADDADELANFLYASKPEAQRKLEQSDLQMARVMEDVVNLLIDKSIIRFTDLPLAAQQKLLSRRQVRDRVNDDFVWSDDDHLSL
ncbi:hypothetical protein [uncultured Gilvimarinus sp.]|uniref:hypothetical protein n=1 Tax=uncultured Gilvimarinus sp. TaxID=1689143 RepID=UPI0030EF3D5D|tara:strand:- start:3456 stop:3785 length:330 start_codon:yes stop_codon:yes gene_type:complete